MEKHILAIELLKKEKIILSVQEGMIRDSSYFQSSPKEVNALRSAISRPGKTKAA